MKLPAIGATVDVPTLHPSAGYDPSVMEKWCGKQRGRVIELVESGDYDCPDNPLICLKIDGEDGASYAWFRASDIRAEALSDPEFSLSVDAMVSEHRPRVNDDPNLLPKDEYVLVFLPEEDSWFAAKRYRGRLAD